MQLDYLPAEPDGSFARGVIPGHFAGFDDIAHGGTVAAVLDDAMWWAIHHSCAAHTMTVELQVRYRRPVPVKTPLSVSGYLERRRGRLFWASATVCADADHEEVLARASGKFLTGRG